MMVQLNMYSGVAVRTSDITKKVELARVLLDAFSTVLYECTLSQSAITLSLLPSLRYYKYSLLYCVEF
jgi:hypothetical protein